MSAKFQRSLWLPAFIALALMTSTGNVIPAAEPIPLRAGPLTMLFDADNAFLRYVKAGPYEVLRGINGRPVRDQFWGTVRPQVTNLELNDQGDHFTLSFDATCRERDIDFRWHGTLTGSRDGRVVFTFDGVAKSSFMRNRIGFCVLHGPSAAGRPWVITDVAGRESEGYFPELISPHQPAKEIAAIAHELAADVWAHVEFAGEVFEMEDQRNWTDASFKTYCIPLERPYPVAVEQGTRISQKIAIRVVGEIPSEPEPHAVTLTLGKQQTPLPRLGLQVSTETNELTQGQIERLKALALDHLRVDLDLADASLAEKLGRAARQAEAVGVPLHVAVHLGEQPEAGLRALADLLRKTQADMAAIFIADVDAEQFALAYQILRSAAGKAQFGFAKDTNFVELNRDRPTDETIALVSYAINPQIHAFDNASIVETLPIEGDTVRTARQFIGERRLAIGPITLRPRQVSQEPLPGELPADVDARQASRFARPGHSAASIIWPPNFFGATYYETVGWKGVMDLDDSVSRPDKFPSTPGKVFPVYEVFREVATSPAARHSNSTRAIRWRSWASRYENQGRCGC